MPLAARSALVLQGGGALGAYELGAARRLYEDTDFAPDLISGVSIGAVTAVLLARPAAGLSPMQALERFWAEVTVTGWLFPPALRPYASMFGNAHFFTPRVDLIDLPGWTSLYDTRPLRRTLEGLVDLAALADPQAQPRLLVSATDIAAGQIVYFDSAEGGLSLDHILASGSLPPSFPMTRIGERFYWDGGLFDNTPLGKVLDLMGIGAADPQRLYVVNLFPNEAPIPRNMAEVGERTLNLAFANRTREDLKLMGRFDEVAALMTQLAELGDANPLRDMPAFRTIADRGYVPAPQVVEITRREQAQAIDVMDFSPAAIQSRADEGYLCAAAALAGPKSATDALGRAA